jgi:hypothetical protein
MKPYQKFQIIAVIAILIAMGITRRPSQPKAETPVTNLTPTAKAVWLQADEPMVYINGKLTAPKSAKIAAK